METVTPFLRASNHCYTERMAPVHTPGRLDRINDLEKQQRVRMQRFMETCGEIRVEERQRLYLLFQLLLTDRAQDVQLRSVGSEPVLEFSQLPSARQKRLSEILMQIYPGTDTSHALCELFALEREWKEQ